MSAVTTVFTSHWPDVQVPAVPLPEFLLAGAAGRAQKPALIDGPSGRVTSYGELADRVRRPAAGLAARGLRKGDVFAILAPNQPEWLVAAFGAMTAGGVVTGINPLHTPGEVAGQLTGAAARFLLTVPPFLPTARAAVDRSGGQVEIVLVGPPTEGTTPFANLLTHDDELPAVAIDSAVDLAMLPYSSGTSGLPKGVMLTIGPAWRTCCSNRPGSSSTRTTGCSPSPRSSTPSGPGWWPEARCTPARRSSRCRASTSRRFSVSSRSTGSPGWSWCHRSCSHWRSTLLSTGTTCPP